MAWKKLGSHKKKGSSRISRMVSDLQQPKMADSSLVVATGFPTSIVDLFVKNRARLRRPRTQNGSKSRPEHEGSEDSLVASDPVTGSGENVEEVVKVVSLCEEEVKVKSLSVEGNCGGNGRKVVGLWGLLRVVVVLGLGLSVEKMVVGVTLSAFALILLDCCWGRLRLLFEPCLRRVLDLVWWVGREKDDEEKRDEEGDIMVEVVELCRDRDGLVSDGEIQVVECDKEDVMIQVVECDKEDVMEVMEMMGEELDLVGLEERVVECEKEKSKSGKIRRKIVKNLVPKKLRKEVKKRKIKRKEKELELKNEAFDCPDDSSGKLQVPQNDEGDVDEEESSRNGSISEDGLGIGCCSFSQELQLDKGTTVPVNEKIRVPANKSKRNLSYGIVLLVLAGLVGGRIAAFLLTVGLCLVLKLVKRLRK